MLQTERLVLRRFCQEDLQDLHEYLSDEEVVKFEPYHAMDINAVRENLIWRIPPMKWLRWNCRRSTNLLEMCTLAKEIFSHWSWGTFSTKTIGARATHTKVVWQ